MFAPDYAPEEIAEIAAKLRKAAGLGEPTGVAHDATAPTASWARSRTDRLMAELTKLESKLAEVLGLAGRPRAPTDTVKGMLDDDEPALGRAARADE